MGSVAHDRFSCSTTLSSTAYIGWECGSYVEVEIGQGDGALFR